MECDRCEGHRRLLSYVSVEVTEETSTNDDQYIPSSLPKFIKKDSPVSNLKGKPVFKQDEPKRIDQFTFQSQSAATVLSNAVNRCRASHSGHILRQSIEVETCSIIEYRYRHSTKEYSIYINPEHGLVEDSEGPIQSFIANIDALAEKALKENRYEDAYRLATRGLCMEEPTEFEKKIRDQACQALVNSYGKFALIGWLVAAMLWWLFNGLFSDFHVSWWFVIGLIPLPFMVQWFAQDLGVRFPGPRKRIRPAILLGIVSFLSGAGIADGASWANWIALTVLIVVTGIFGLVRSKERARHAKLEAHFGSFSNSQVLEAYVSQLDPKPGQSGRMVFALVFFVIILAVQPSLYMASEINNWALDRTKIEFSLQVRGASAQFHGNVDMPPEVQFNGKPIHSGDKVQPGKGVLDVDDMRFMPFRKEMQISYGSTANAGTIELVPAHGQLVIISDPTDAEFEISGNGHHWEGKLPMRIEDVPVGNYSLAVTRKGWEQDADISITRGSIMTNITEFPYGSIKVTSEPTGLTISTNDVVIGKTPLTLQELKPGKYALAVSDGENDLMADVSVGPKEQAEHAFVFRYSAVQLTSTPPGATVIRKGKEIGITPLTLNHIPVGETMVRLELQGYVSTNVPILAVEGSMTNFAAKLISTRYLDAMQQAQQALDAGQLVQASNFVATALASEPGNSAAMELQDKVLQTITKAEEARKEAARAAETAREEAEQEKAKAKALESEQQFQRILDSIQGAATFPEHTRKYPFAYDKVWYVIHSLLSSEDEKIGQSDEDSGILITELTRHNVILVPRYRKYCLLVEKESRDSTKVTLELLRFYGDYVGMTEVRKPEDLDYVWKKAESFLDEVGKRLQKGDYPDSEKLASLRDEMTTESPDDLWHDFTKEFPDSAYSRTVVYRYTKSLSEVEDGTLKTLDSSLCVWKLQKETKLRNETKPDERTILMAVVPGGITAKAGDRIHFSVPVHELVLGHG